MAGRILADLGAEVVLVEPPAGDPLTRAPPPLRRVERGQAQRRASTAPTIPRLDALLADADVVIDTPGFPGRVRRSTRRARPHAVWVRVTPFGLDGPRAGWRATDLGVMAASGNMYCTGDPDRAPVRCTRAVRLRARRRRGRVRGADRAVRAGVAAARRRLDAGGRARREHGDAGAAFPQTGLPRAAARRQHRPHPRDLADARTASSRSACAAARPASRASRR